ncbi:MAG: NAD(P)-dependent oxidoreductase [Cyanobacteria bacterium CRU_2_1]|nr:NAD(P)-dependent oxidoreductase [Cyanobacteria bacterium CRU_2_1]
MKRIAVLGAGAMGSRIAQNLLKAEYSVVVYNRTADKVEPLVNQGATYAATPIEAAQQADVVMSMLTNDEVSRQVWLDPKTGALQGLRKEAIAIESSTLTVEWTQTLAAAIAAAGADFLAVLVVGSRPQAEAGKLIYLAGGKAEVLAKVQPVLQSAGAAVVHHVGTVGQGMIMKLAVNALFGIQVAALAELIAMLGKYGIAPDKAMEYFGGLPVTSLAAKGAGSLMVASHHAPMFPIELVEKDFRYAIQAAQAADAAIPASTSIHSIYQDAIVKGYGDRNITGVIQLFT